MGCFFMVKVRRSISSRGGMVSSQGTALAGMINICPCIGHADDLDHLVLPGSSILHDPFPLWAQWVICEEMLLRLCGYAISHQTFTHCFLPSLMSFAWIHDYYNGCQKIFSLYHFFCIYYWYLLEGRAVSAYLFICIRMGSWNFILFSRL